MLCATGHDVLSDYATDWKTSDTRWKTDGLATRSLDTSSWVNDIRGTEQEKLVEQALNLDLNNLTEKQLVEIFAAVTDEPECKAQKYIYEANNNLIAAFQTYYSSNKGRPDNLPRSPSFSSSSRNSCHDNTCHMSRDSCHDNTCHMSRDSCHDNTCHFASAEFPAFSTPVKRISRPQRDSFSKDCEHRCCMVHAEACCDCSDDRPQLELYDIYIKNEGVCTTRYRWLFYCPVCKRRRQNHSPPESGTYAPLYRPKGRQRTCSKHKVCPPSCSKAKDTCVIC